MSWIDGARQRLRELFHPSRSADEFDEELGDHFERELERQRQRAPDRARRAARLRAGAAVVAREAARDGRSGRLLIDLLRDVRYGARGIRRNPGLSAAVALSLALGIGGTTAIFSVVHGVLLRPLPYPRSDELHDVRVWWNDFSASMSTADYLALTESAPASVHVGAWFLPDGGFAMATAEGPEVVEGGFVSAELPAVLGVAPILGRGFTGDRTAREVLIAESLWRDHFGSRSDVTGTTVTLDGDPYSVVGVMPSGFNLPGQRDGRIWARAVLDPPRRRGPFFLTVLARLPPDMTAEGGAGALTAAARPVLRDRYGIVDPWRYGVRPMRDVLVGSTRQTLWLLFAAVGLVLLIAVANVANLLMARGTVRAREMAVRAALGAGRGRLVRQMLAETSLLGIVGGTGGLLLAAAVVQVARTQAIDVVPRIDEVGVDVTVALFALAAGTIAGLAAGVLPAMRVSWPAIGDTLRAGSRAVGEDLRHGTARQVLVVAEVALALTVVTSAALIVKTLMRIQEVDPRFRAEGVLSFRLALPDGPYRDPDRTLAFMNELERRLRSMPGVHAVAAAMSLPPDRLVMSNNYTVEGQVPDSAGRADVADWNIVTPRYFRAMGIRLVRGRVFDDGDRATAPRVAVVNEAFERRHYHESSAIGRRLKGGDWDAKEAWTTIVGVVADVPYEAGVAPDWSAASPMVYGAYTQNRWLQSPYVIVHGAADPATLVPAIRTAVASIDPRIPLRDVASMTARLHRSRAMPRFRGLLFSALGVLALALAATGIYGVMAYHVDQRRRETAIRRALGARGDQVIGATMMAGARLALAGVAVGTAAALAATRALSAVLYHVEPRDPAILVGTAVLLVVSAFVACAWPAMRAARVDPATLLRDE